MSIKDKLDNMPEADAGLVSDTEAFIADVPKSNRNKLVLLAALAVSGLAGIAMMMMQGNKNAPAPDAPTAPFQKEVEAEPKPASAPPAIALDQGGTAPAPATSNLQPATDGMPAGGDAFAPAQPQPLMGATGPATPMPSAAPAQTSPTAAAPSTAPAPAAAPAPVATVSTTKPVAPQSAAPASTPAAAVQPDAKAKPQHKAEPAPKKRVATTEKTSKSEPIAAAEERRPAPKRRSDAKYSATPTGDAKQTIVLEPVTAETILVVR